MNDSIRSAPTKSPKRHLLQHPYDVYLIIYIIDEIIKYDNVITTVILKHYKKSWLPCLDYDKCQCRSFYESIAGGVRLLS